MSKKIAIPINNGILDGHFGHCKHFSIFEIDGNKILDNFIVDAPPHEPGLLPKFLSEKGVTDIIAGGMGHRAIELFKQRGVNVFVGAPQLAAKNLVDGFLNNTIRFNANYCDH
jgi:predicted Fe-Mo cluster-binding NifX family protein